jgi:hypothetical protein
MELEIRTAGRIDTQIDTSRHACSRADIMPYKRDSGIFGGRPEFHLDVAAAEITKAGNRGWPSECALAARN